MEVEDESSDEDAPPRPIIVAAPAVEDIRGVFNAQPRFRDRVLSSAPGQFWPPGAVWGLDLPDLPGTRQERASLRIRRQPRVPPVICREPNPPGPLLWFCPCWVELPLPELIPKDAWYFDRNKRTFTPSTWFVPIWGDENAPGDDPCKVVMVYWFEGRYRYLQYTVRYEWGVLALEGA